MMENEITLPIWSYQQNSRKWEARKINDDPQGNHLGEFRVLTYNVWFSNEHQPMRFQGLCHLLQQSQADIIGLQEVTKPILDSLLQQPFIQKYYLISDIDCQTFNSWYGVILLISNRLLTKQMVLVNFPHSTMGRHLIMVDIQIQPNQIVRIGTVHLESLNNQLQRSEQLAICQYAFQKHSPETCILMGDFNFSDDHQEDIDQFSILSKWIDVWKSLVHANEYRYTFDTDTNLMIRRNNRYRDRSRYDRIILRSRSIQPKRIDIIGRHIIGYQENIPVFISDHFSLLAVFKVIS